MRAHRAGLTTVVDSMTPGPFASLPQLAPNEVALLGSQSATPGSGGIWLARLSAGDLIATPYSLLDPTVTQLVTGSTVLVSGGQLAPPNSFPPHGANAETIVGLSADGKHLAMSVVGKGGGAPGVTPEQAAQLVLNMKMDSGILLDGGGSSTLVAQLPNTGSGVSVVSTSTGQTNYPNGSSNQRFVGDGFFLYPQATPPPDAHADLQVGLHTPLFTPADSPVSSTLTVTNRGPHAATPTDATFVVPAGYTVQNNGGGTPSNGNVGGFNIFRTPPLAAGATATFTTRLIAPSGFAFGLSAALVVPVATDPNFFNNFALAGIFSG